MPSDAVATIGDVSVSQTDFEQLMTQAKTQMEASGMSVPEKGSASYDHYVAQIVQYMVQEQVIAQSAEDLGVKVTDKDVADQVKQLEEAYGGKEKVLALLKEQGMTMELLERSIMGQTLSQRAIEVVTKSATVSDADVKAYWDAHKTEYEKDKKTTTPSPRPRRPSRRRCSAPSSSSSGTPGWTSASTSSAWSTPRVRPRAERPRPPLRRPPAADGAAGPRLSGGGRRPSLRPPPYAERGRPAVAVAGPVRAWRARSP